jgi:DNA-binding IclR family transcriptional regulator
MVAEPGEMPLQIGYRVGSRHSLTQGAAGIAILAERPPNQNDSEAIKQARLGGYSLTHGQLQRGAIGVASAISSPSFRRTIEACVGVVAMEDLDKEIAISEVKSYAQRIAELIAQ